MYWLETTNRKYTDYNGKLFNDSQEAITYYNALVTIMKHDLPESEWFDLRLMRDAKEGDFMPNRDQIVRSWVY
jgi:hypothetical protein